MNTRRISWRVAIVLTLLGLGPATGLPLEQPWNVRQLGQIGGVCLTVEVVGRYAYIGEGPNLTILDIANPSLPVPVGRLSLRDFSVTDVRVKNGLAYLAGGSQAGLYGLQIVDVTNPRSPRLRGFFPTPHVAWGVYVTNGLAYVAYGWYLPGQSGVSIVDVTNPSSPTLRGSFETGVITWRVYVTGGIAYVATDGGLCIYDVTNPAAPRRLSTTGREYCSDVLVSGNLAYSTDSYGLLITDVTSPSAPTQRGRLPNVYPKGLSLSGSLIFLAQWRDPPYSPNGLGVIDVSHPSSPGVLASLATSGTAWAVAVSSGTAYVALEESGLAIVDVRNPSRPTLRTYYDTLSHPRDVQVIGNVAYVANGVRGFKTVDVSNPRSPRILSSCRIPGVADAIAVSGNLAYLVGVTYYDTHPPSFQIVDVTNPSLPWLRGSCMVPGGGEDVAVSGGLAYLASAGLVILDVANPSSPTLRGQYFDPGPTPGVFVSGGLAYLGNFIDFRIFDVRNPALPVLRSSLYLYHSVVDVQVSNGIAYTRGVGDYNAAFLTSVDVRNPDAPRRLADYQAGQTLDYYGGLYVTDGYAYAVMDHLRILDVRDPTRPTLRGYYPTGIWGRPFVSGDLVYLAGGGRGLRIYQFTGRVSAADRQWQLYR